MPAIPVVYISKQGCNDGNTKACYLAGITGSREDVNPTEATMFAVRVQCGIQPPTPRSTQEQFPFFRRSVSSGSRLISPLPMSLKGIPDAPVFNTSFPGHWLLSSLLEPMVRSCLRQLQPLWKNYLELFSQGGRVFQARVAPDIAAVSATCTIGQFHIQPLILMNVFVEDILRCRSPI